MKNTILALSLFAASSASAQPAIDLTNPEQSIDCQVVGARDYRSWNNRVIVHINSKGDSERKSYFYQPDRSREDDGVFSSQGTCTDTDDGIECESTSYPWGFRLKLDTGRVFGSTMDVSEHGDYPDVRLLHFTGVFEGNYSRQIAVRCVTWADTACGWDGCHQEFDRLWSAIEASGGAGIPHP
jgi:hypothetical protein